jgi:hypothetical protein
LSLGHLSRLLLSAYAFIGRWSDLYVCDHTTSPLWLFFDVYCDGQGAE